MKKKKKKDRFITDQSTQYTLQNAYEEEDNHKESTSKSKIKSGKEHSSQSRLNKFRPKKHKL